MDLMCAILPTALSTGVFAAIMTQIFYWINHRPCMKIRFNRNMYFPSTADVDGCVAPYRLFFQVLISNQSTDSIAITEIRLSLKGIDEELFVNDFLDPAISYEMEPYYQEIEDDKMVTKKDIIKIANPIKSGTVIRPYEAMNGVIFIIGCPEIENNKIEGVLKIDTTRKCYEYNVEVSRYCHEKQKYID